MDEQDTKKYWFGFVKGFTTSLIITIILSLLIFLIIWKVFLFGAESVEGFQKVSPQRMQTSMSKNGKFVTHILNAEDNSIIVTKISIDVIKPNPSIKYLTKTSKYLEVYGTQRVEIEMRENLGRRFEPYKIYLRIEYREMIGNKEIVRTESGVISGRLE